MHFTTIFVPILAALGSAAASPVAATTDVEHSADHYAWKVSNIHNVVHNAHNIESFIEIHGKSHHGQPAFKAHCRAKANAGQNQCKGAKGLYYRFDQVDSTADQTLHITHNAGGKVYKGSHTIQSNKLKTSCKIKPKRTA